MSLRAGYAQQIGTAQTQPRLLDAVAEAFASPFQHAHIRPGLPLALRIARALHAHT